MQDIVRVITQVDVAIININTLLKSSLRNIKSTFIETTIILSHENKFLLQIPL